MPMEGVLITPQLTALQQEPSMEEEISISVV